MYSSKRRNGDYLRSCCRSLGKGCCGLDKVDYKLREYFLGEFRINLGNILEGLGMSECGVGERGLIRWIFRILVGVNGG